MKIFSSILICLILGITVSGQLIERHEADSLFTVLAKTKLSIERIKILNGLAQFYIFKPGENQIDFDSASTYLTEAHRLNESAKSASMNGQLLLTESFMLREKGQKESARLKVEDAIKTHELSNDKYYLGKALYELSGYYGYRDSAEYIKRVTLVERSIAAFQQSKAIREKAGALQMLGDLYNINSEPDKAIETLKFALAAYDSAGHKALQGVYILLEDIYYSKSDYKQAIYYGLLAVKTAENCHDSTMQLCQIYSSLGSLYTDIAQHETALRYDKEALKIAVRYDDRSTVAFLLLSICSDFNLLGRPQEALNFLSSMPSKFLKQTGIFEQSVIGLAYMEAYIRTGQNSKAEYYCDTLLKMVDDKNISLYLQNDIYRGVSFYYLMVRQFQKTRFYLTKNLSISKSLGTKELSQDERIWYKLDSAEGNYQSAFRHLLTYKIISDSLFNETKARQLQQLEVEYETAKKEDSLKQKNQHISLLTQRSNLQQTNLKQANLIKNITIAGAVLALIAFGMLYYQFRINQRKNKIILQKNEELKNMLAEKEWWLKEVHHRVKNNLHTIICLLESQAMYLEKDALQAIEKSQHRIYAMSLIHQKLYQNEDVKSIDMSVYLDEFLRYLKDSFDVDGIEFVTEVEPIQLNLTQAIPVGLIINEAVTNSIKYAFTDPVDTRIFVSMVEAAGIVNLIIADNGKGFTPTEDAETRSLGIQLIKGLSKEIRGSLSIKGDNGTKVAIQFKKDIITSTEQIMQKELAGYEA